MRTVYLDNAATTPINSGVKREVARGMEMYGNPSSYNNAGRKAAKELSIARIKIARFLGAHPEEIVFTSSGSEANNMAVFGLALKSPNNKDEIITTPIEHLSVLEPVKSLQYENKKVIVYIKVDGLGFVDLQDLSSKISHKTLLVSVMYANNEIGTIEPIIKIGKIIKSFREKNAGFPLFHIDACQAAGYLDMDVNRLGVDLLTFNGSKMGGPRGIGVLYIRKEVKLIPYIMGGGQERGLRAGTENLPAILGLAQAIELIDEKEGARLAELRDYFIKKIREIMLDIKINGPTFAKASVGKPMKDNRLPNNINISVPGLDSENLLLELDKYGIRAGSGSACTSRSIEPSHVLEAIGVEKKYLSGAIRFSMGKQTIKKDLDYVLKILPKIVLELKIRYGKN